MWSEYLAMTCLSFQALGTILRIPAQVQDDAGAALAR